MLLSACSCPDEAEIILKVSSNRILWIATSCAPLFIYLFFFAAGSSDEEDSHLLFSVKGLLNIAGMVSGCSSTFSRPNDRKFQMLS